MKRGSAVDMSSAYLPRDISTALLFYLLLCQMFLLKQLFYFVIKPGSFLDLDTTDLNGAAVSSNHFSDLRDPARNNSCSLAPNSAFSVFYFRGFLNQFFNPFFIIVGVVHNHAIPRYNNHIYLIRITSIWIPIKVSVQFTQQCSTTKAGFLSQSSCHKYPSFVLI